MQRYFNQSIPQAVSPTEAWLQSDLYRGGGYPAKGGLDYVPWDNFPIRAHEGEAVLTERDAEEWRGNGGQEEITIIVENYIDGDQVSRAIAKRIRGGNHDIIDCIDHRIKVMAR